MKGALLTPDCITRNWDAAAATAAVAAGDGAERRHPIQHRRSIESPPWSAGHRRTSAANRDRYERAFCLSSPDESPEMVRVTMTRDFLRDSPDVIGCHLRRRRRRRHHRHLRPRRQEALPQQHSTRKRKNCAALRATCNRKTPKGNESRGRRCVIIWSVCTTDRKCLKCDSMRRLIKYRRFVA